MVRLAVVVNSFPTLSETFIYNKVAGLLKAGLDVTVWVHSPRNDAAAFADRTPSISLARVRPALTANGKRGLPGLIIQSILRKPGFAWRLWGQATSLYPNRRRALRAWVLALPMAQENFDLIHFELSGLAVMYLDALPLLKPAMLLTSCRGAAEQITPLLHLERGDKLAKVFSQMDAVHCVSTDIRDTALQYGLHPEQAFINHPAINIQDFVRHSSYPMKTRGPFHLLSVGRLHWKKGFEFGLLAVRCLIDAGLDVQYQIVGAGVEEEKLRFLINDLGLSERVVLVGRQTASAVRKLMEEADVFILPSLSEGLSNAALEAMAMQIPVVSTTAGGMSEAITDGVEGFLVPPMHPEIMGEKVRALLLNPKQRYEMGLAGRERVCLAFQLKDQIDRFDQFYRRVLGDHDR